MAASRAKQRDQINEILLRDILLGEYEFYTLKLERDDAGRISKMEEYNNFNPQEEHFTEWSLFYDLSGKLSKVNRMEGEEITERIVFRYE